MNMTISDIINRKIKNDTSIVAMGDQIDLEMNIEDSDKILYYNMPEVKLNHLSIHNDFSFRKYLLYIQILFIVICAWIYYIVR